MFNEEGLEFVRPVPSSMRRIAQKISRQETDAVMSRIHECRWEDGTHAAQSSSERLLLALSINETALADVRGCPRLVEAADDRKFHRPCHTFRGPVAVVQPAVIHRVGEVPT